MSVARLDSVNHKKNTSGMPDPDAVLLAGPFVHDAKLDSSDLIKMVKKAIDKSKAGLGIVSYEGQRIRVDKAACVKDGVTLEEAMEAGRSLFDRRMENFKNNSLYTGWAERVDVIDGNMVNPMPTVAALKPTSVSDPSQPLLPGKVDNFKVAPVSVSQINTKPSVLPGKTSTEGPTALFSALITRARDLLEKGQADAALKAASNAVQAIGDDHRGHYYRAMALMQLGRFDEASSEAVLALERAPEVAKSGVNKLVRAIADSKALMAQVAAAEQALTVGANQEAVDAYMKAYRLSGDPGLAVNAAKVLIDKRKDKVQAAKLLRDLLAKERQQPGTQPESTLAEIKDLLKSISSDLESLAQVRFMLAKTQEGKTALATLDAAIEAQPNHYDAHSLKLQLLAGGNEIGKFMEALALCITDLGLIPHAVAEVPDVTRFAKNPAFMEFLENLGPEGIKLKARLNTKVAEQNRKEQEAAEYAERKRKSDAEYSARQKQKFLDCAREGGRLDSEIAEDRRRIELADLSYQMGSLTRSAANEINKDHKALFKRIVAFKERCSGKFSEVDDAEKSSICSHPATQSAWCEKF